MKVILKKTGEVKEVSSGYARNYLIPHGLAEVATAETIRAATERQKKYGHQIAVQQSEWSALVSSLPTLTVQMKAAANEDGTLFGAIQESAILEQMSKQHGIHLDRGWIHVQAPVKQSGNQTIPVEFPNKQLTHFQISVNAQ